MTLNNFISA